MPDRRSSPARPRRSVVLPRVGIAGAFVAAIAVVACGGDDGEPSGSTIAPDAAAIVDASAAAMGDVTSVRFGLERTGAPLYIDSAGAIALNTVDGRFNVPSSAEAVVEVEVGGALTTELAAIAVDDDVWLSNPITGEMEPLPPGTELDPSNFFDPEGGWRPLLENLTDVELVGVEDRDGTTYHVRGTAPAAQVEVVTAGLIDGTDVVVDLWIDPATALVTAIEFDVDVGDGEMHWQLELTDYGEEFEIAPPPGT